MRLSLRHLVPLPSLRHSISHTCSLPVGRCPASVRCPTHPSKLTPQSLAPTPTHAELTLNSHTGAPRESPSSLKYGLETSWGGHGAPLSQRSLVCTASLRECGPGCQGEREVEELWSQVPDLPVKCHVSVRCHMLPPLSP